MIRSFSTSQLSTQIQACLLQQNGSREGELRVRDISTDSRSLQANDVFLALRGDRFDGHGFVQAARDKGAIAAVVDRQFQPTPELLAQSDMALLQVTDTLAAYQQLGQAWRQQFDGPVVAITGSVGKTTTKELIAAVLAQAGGPDTVLKTQANYNNEIGVPKTLLQLRSQHRFAVVEMGMRGLGEIELLSRLAQPDIAVITNVGTAHIERLGSEAAIAQAKCELLKHLKPNGLAVLNHDNPLLLEHAAKVWSGRTVTFGFQGGDLQGQWGNGEQMDVQGTTFELPLPGRHNALNLLAALAVAQELGIDWSTLTQLSLALPGGRAQRYELARDVVLLDETYNAGLESMGAALQLLADTPGRRRIAVLGTMKELGDRSLEFHRQVGERVAQLQLDALWTLADPQETEALVAGAGAVATQTFERAEQLQAHLQARVQSGDRLLFKASRAVALDQVVDQFRAGWNSD